MGLSQPYQKLSVNESYSDQPQEEPLEEKPLPLPRRSLAKRTVLIYLAIGTIVVAVLAAIAARSFTSTAAAPAAPATTNTTEELEILSCGSTAEEARALDCVYDVMMQLWMPRPCYDENLTERFLKEGNWTWWADAGATEVMSDERIRLGEHDRVYVSADYHKTHCIFAWEKLVRAMRNQTPMIKQLISYDHTIHCRHNALAAEHAQGAIAPTGFARCASYETWMKALPPDTHSSTD